MINSLDRSILTNLCRQWKTAVEKKRKKPAPTGQVTLSLAPEVSFGHDTSTEEETVFTFLIENLGNHPIWDLCLSVRPRKRSDSIVFLMQRQDSLEGAFLNPGEWMTHRIELLISESAYADVVLEYMGWSLPPEKVQGIRLVRAGGRIEPGTRCRNPYIPDGPLRREKEFEDFGRIGSRGKAFDEVIKVITDRSGERVWLNLYGLRRTGKTSLLNQLRYQVDVIQTETAILDCVPVYFDCLEMDETEAWDEGRVLKSIAFAIRRQVQRRFREIDIDDRSEDAAPQEAFRDFVASIYDQVGEDKRLILMLDEADVLAEPPFGAFAKRLLFDLANSTVLTQPGFSLVLATERAIEELWSEFASQKDRTLAKFGTKLTPLTQRLELFTREEVAEIAQKAVWLTYTDLALSYLWRLTGGYPSLVQAICCYIAKDRLEKSQQAVTLNVVRRVTEEFIRNPDNHPYINYLQLGFTAPEWTLLQDLVWAGAIDDVSLRIDMPVSQASETRETALMGLEAKGVIQRMRLYTDQGETIWRQLRVGFFKLWIEALQLGKESSGNDQS